MKKIYNNNNSNATVLVLYVGSFLLYIMSHSGGEAKPTNSLSPLDALSCLLKILVDKVSVFPERKGSFIRADQASRGPERVCLQQIDSVDVLHITACHSPGCENAQGGSGLQNVIDHQLHRLFYGNKTGVFTTQ